MASSGKRQRDASFADDEDEPVVRRARSEEEQESTAAGPFLVTPSVLSTNKETLKEEIEVLLCKDTKMPANARPMASTIEEYCLPGATERMTPRPEWYRPWPGRKRPREAEDSSSDLLSVNSQVTLPPPEVEPPPVAAAAAAPGHMEAPADGLLHDNAFADFQRPPSPALLQEEDSSSSLSVEEHSELLASVSEILDVPSAAAAAPDHASVVKKALSKDSAFLKEETVELRLATFGRDCDTALHYTIREGANDAAIELLNHGALVHADNVKGVTPLILASQKGNLLLVGELLKRGACILEASLTGSTPLIQAAHFGHLQVVRYLLDRGAGLEAANKHNTTALMRAAQEGHYEIVSLLLERHANVNRVNNEHMSALMLASQRGHESIVELLIEHGADVDATTLQDSTSLMLACKRGHTNAVRALVTAGCELCIKDSRGRTARDILRVRHEGPELLELLEPDMQVDLMRRKSRVSRNYTMMVMWNLLQQERAHVHNVSIHHVELNERDCSSRATLIRTMLLPAPLVEHVASFMPLSRLWKERTNLLVRKCTIDADAAVAASLEIIDEVLEDGGFLEACDEANVTPPTNFESWAEWKAFGCSLPNTIPPAVISRPPRRNALEATLPGLPRFEPIGSSSSIIPPPRPSCFVEMRRGVCFLQLLAHRTPVLAQRLSQPPYYMSSRTIQQLITTSDIQSVSRRLGSSGVHFEAPLAIEMLMLASSVQSWYEANR